MKLDDSHARPSRAELRARAMGAGIERRRRSETAVSVIGAFVSAAAGVLSVLVPTGVPGASDGDSLAAAAAVLVTITAVAAAALLTRLGLTARRRERRRAVASRMAAEVWQATLAAHGAGPQPTAHERW